MLRRLSGQKNDKYLLFDVVHKAGALRHRLPDKVLAHEYSYDVERCSYQTFRV